MSWKHTIKETEFHKSIALPFEFVTKDLLSTIDSFSDFWENYNKLRESGKIKNVQDFLKNQINLVKDLEKKSQNYIRTIESFR